MPIIDCLVRSITLPDFKKLLDKHGFNENLPEEKQREIGRKAAMEYHAKLHNDLNDLKKSIGVKTEKYISPDTSDKVKEVNDKYDKLIESQKTKENAIQEPSPTSILQHTQETTGETRSERERMERSQQGNEPSGKSSETKGTSEVQDTHVEHPPTSLSYSGTGKIETEFGADVRERTKKKHDLETIKEADNLLEKGWDVRKALDKMQEEGYIPSDAEYINLTRYGAELSDRLRSLKNEPNSPEYSKTFDELNRLANLVNEYHGKAAGRTLGIRARYKTVAEGSYGDYMLTEREANNDAPLTPAQTEIANKQFTEFETAKTKFEEDKAKFDSEVARFNADKELYKTKKSVATGKRKNHEDLVKERDQIFTDIKDKLRKARGEASSTVVPYAKELFAIAPDVLKLARNLVEDGIIKLEEVVKSIHGQLKEDAQNIQEKDIHDILAGEYTEKKLTKKETSIQFENLRTKARLINKLEAVKNNEPASEKGKIKKNQEIEQFKKELGIDKLEQLESLKNRNEKETSEIKEKIDNKDFAIEEKKTPLMDDKEAQKQFPELFKAAQKSRDELIKAKHDITIRRLKQMYENKTPQEKAVEVFSKSLNIPRTLMASMDVSAPLRQAVIASTAHPVLANEALKFMFRAAADGKVYNRWLDDVHNSPRWDIAEKTKLAITDPESLHVKEHEEAFQGAPYAEKIPIVGAGVRASERAYVGYLNKLRWDLFNMYADRFEEQGKTYGNNKKLYEGLASFINSATGRGGMKGLESASPILNWVLFASKLIASRVNMLGLSDVPNLALRGVTLGKYGFDYGFYTKLPPELRIEAAKDMAKFIAVGMSTLLIAKGLSNALGGNIEVETDPRSSDFGKIKSGNVRWDIWGGFQPYARVLTQAITGQRKASTTGQIYELNGKGFMGETRLTPLANFARGKLAPIPSSVINLAGHRDAVGQPVTVGGQLLSNVTPLIINDVYSAMKDQGVKALYTVGIPSAFGVGVQTYTNKSKDAEKGSGTGAKFKPKQLKQHHQTSR